LFFYWKIKAHVVFGVLVFVGAILAVRKCRRVYRIKKQKR
jgi:hypothetical protein